MAPPERTAFEKWQDTMKAVAKDPRSGDYDAAIQRIVMAYNQHLASAKGYTALDWKLVKAMVWTESGGPESPAWTARPIQIGNAGDPGLMALLSGKEGGELVLPPSIASGLTVGAASSDPVKNIEAGVGYLLMRAASYGFADVEDPKDPGSVYTVQAGDSLDRIAVRNQSTVNELKALNPSAKILHAGQKIKIRRAKIEKRIAGFALLNTVTVARLYNIGDPKYANKLDYCLDLIK